MKPEVFVTVFDVGASGFKDWDFAAFGLIFVAVGLVLLFAPRLIRATGIPFVDFESWRFTALRYMFPIFGLLWTLTSFGTTFSQYLEHRRMILADSCAKVEGTVDNFVPMPAAGHGDESFSVSGIGFAYSDYVVTDAFNNAASLGGPIRSGQYVRICYDPDSHAILRLAIRGYTGPIKTYDRSMDFPAPPATKNDEPGPLPWYGSLFVYLYALDFAGLLLLYPVYLRTYFRLTAVPNVQLVAAAWLNRRETVKFRNTLGRWDAHSNALWLRPRGFNLFQVPLMVAKLKVDPTGTRLDSYEIRFSSGFPVTMIAFFAGVVGTVLQVAPEGAVFVLGFFLVVFLISGAMRLRGMRKRMEFLIEDTLPQLVSPPP